MNQRRYRILYVLQPGGGGAATSLYDLVLGLDKTLYEPIVLFYEPDSYIEKFQALGIKVLVLSKNHPIFSIIFHYHTTENLRQRYGKRLFYLYRGAYIAYLILRVAFLLKSNSITLVHNNDNVTMDRYTALAAKLAGVPQVCHMRSFHNLSNLSRYLVRSVNSFIYVSKTIEKYYLDLGIPATKGQVGYEGFDPSAFEQVNPDYIAKLRTEFGVTDQDFLISSVGRLAQWKGQDYFLEAIAQVIQSQQNIKALVVGPPISNPEDQAYYQKLQRLVIDLQLSNHVIFTGFRADTAQIMAASDIVVHGSSEPEPFGRVVVEGMLAGCPVVATATGGPLESVEDQLTGLLVPPKDASKMAEALLTLIQNREQATAMGQFAKQRAKERFSVEQHVTFVQQTYQKILAPLKFSWVRY